MLRAEKKSDIQYCITHISNFSCGSLMLMNMHVDLTGFCAGHLSLSLFFDILFWNICCFDLYCLWR
jgi:hypothetical protein